MNDVYWNLNTLISTQQTPIENHSIHKYNFFVSFVHNLIMDLSNKQIVEDFMNIYGYIIIL